MRTFEKDIKITGVGIHSGAPVNITIKPSEKPGIFFKRMDINNSKLIPATWDNVFDTSRQNTTIGSGENRVQTIEHLMAALFLMCIDAAIIEIDGVETPIMDGSAYEFIKIFKNTKILEKGPVKKIIIKKEIIAYRREVIKMLPLLNRIVLFFHNLKMGRRENGYVKLSPNKNGLEVKATLIYPDKIIGSQSFDFMFDETEESKDLFFSNIARARTFGRMSEWEYLKKRGMGRGANENNVIALNTDGDGTVNNLIWPDEFVRHKIIDILGDLFTSGGFIYGTVESFKGSHGLNNLVLKKLFSNPENYDIVQV